VRSERNDSERLKKKRADAVTRQPAPTGAISRETITVGSAFYQSAARASIAPASTGALVRIYNKERASARRNAGGQPEADWVKRRQTSASAPLLAICRALVYRSPESGSALISIARIRPSRSRSYQASISIPKDPSTLRAASEARRTFGILHQSGKCPPVRGLPGAVEG